MKANAPIASSGKGSLHRVRSNYELIQDLPEVRTLTT
jgi:hypothetical protein